MAHDKVDTGALAEAIGASAEETEAAWADLSRRGLASVESGKAVVSPLAMRHATSSVQRRLASYLSGYLLTEDSYIVRRAGDPPGSAQILDTRILVEYVANYFRDGLGILEIQDELQVLTRPQVEAAIEYYLGHRQEIEREIAESRRLYEASAPVEGRIAA